MKKLSHIVESLWSDMQDRNGMVKVRKEDDVELMDCKTFYDYLEKNYKDKVYDISQEVYNTRYHIYVDIIKNIYVHIIYNIEEDGLQNISRIIIGEPKTKESEKIVSSLYDQFNVEPPRTVFYTREITTKDSSEFTNQTVLDMIDILIEQTKSMNESLWSDIQDRNGMVKVRKEDDINLLDENDFEKYLQDHYNVTNGYSIYNLGGITVPVLKSSFADEHTFALIYDGVCQDSIYILDDLQDYYPQLYKELQKEFVLSHRGSIFNITPKSGEKCTNKFCIEVLDFIINNAKKDLIIEKK